MNPYAPPKAKVEEADPPGRVWRDGKLVRMDRSGAMPGRCVVCNGGLDQRVERTLYWSPPALRYPAYAVPFALLIGGLVFRIPTLAAAFWPTLIVLGIAQYVMRKKLTVHLGLCARHRRQRSIMRAVSVSLLVGMLALLYDLSSSPTSLALLPVCIAMIIALALVQSRVGVQAVSLQRFDREHVWLAGTGKAFRQALPELPPT